jgi:hypothetical protein
VKFLLWRLINFSSALGSIGLALRELLGKLLHLSLLIQLSILGSPVQAKAGGEGRISARRIGPNELREFAKELGFNRRQTPVKEAFEKLIRVYPEEILSEWENALRGPFEEVQKDGSVIFINFGRDRIIAQQRSKAVVI